MSQLHFSHYVGIDVSKDFLDVCLLPENKFFKAPNSNSGIKKLIKQIPPNSAILLEATGGLERLPARHLAHDGFDVCITNPKPIYHYRKSLNYLDKTDKIDSLVIARYAQERNNLRYGLASEETMELSEYNHARTALNKSITQTRNRLSRTSNKLVKSMYKKQLNVFMKQLQLLEEEMLLCISNREDLQHRFELLQTIPGIGKKTALTLISQLPELGTLEHKPLSKLVGVAPMANDSGNHLGKRYIQGGRIEVRNALYMAALVATRHNDTIKAYYQALIARGKPKKSAIVACMSKLLRMANSVIKNDQPFFVID